jgi:hypothetical protein
MIFFVLFVSLCLKNYNKKFYNFKKIIHFINLNNIWDKNERNKIFLLFLYACAIHFIKRD